MDYFFLIKYFKISNLVWIGTCHLKTANPQFLKLKGTQQAANSYTSMGTKLPPPPYTNQDCLPV